MKTVYVSVLISAFTLFTACGDRTTAQVGEHAGTVVEAMDAAGYTYALIDTGTEKIWAAGPQCAVSPGDAVPVPHGMVMENFTSKTLGRTFEKIHFVQSITGSKQPQDVCSFKQKPAQDGCSRTEAPAAPPEAVAGIKKPEGGYAVADIYAKKNTLAGKTVTLRGTVVKYNAAIMGKNWLHVQDGTGRQGAHDITVTTTDTAQVGDTVLVKGTVAADKDFGYGYRYEVLIDNATILGQ